MVGRIVHKSQDGTFFIDAKKGNMSRVDLILKKTSEVEQRKEQMRQDKEKKELEGCTFSPQIFSSTPISTCNKMSKHLDSIRNISPSRAESIPKKPSWEIREEKELAECTFKPRINKPPKSAGRNTLTVKD